MFPTGFSVEFMALQEEFKIANLVAGSYHSAAQILFRLFIRLTSRMAFDRRRLVDC